MDIEQQAEAAQTWEPGDPGPRPYDPDSADLMRTAALIENAFRVIRQDPLLSAEMRRDQDPAQYLPLTKTADGRARLRELIEEDPGLGLWLESTPEGMEVLGRAYLMPYPDAATAAERAQDAGATPEQRLRAERSAKEQARWDAYVASPRYAERRQRTLDAMLDAIEQRAQQSPEAGAN